MRRFSFLLATAFIVTLVGCGGSTNAKNSGPVLSSIQVTGPNPTMVVGDTQQLRAAGSYSNGSNQDLTTSAGWSSSDSNVATVTSSGMLTAKAAGQCSISAKSGTVTGTFSLTVAPALVSIAVTPASPSIAVSTSLQFIATGTYSDNSTQNLTSKVTWASSNTAVATISSSAPTTGMAKAISAGNTTISATMGSISGNTLLTVTSATPTAITILPANSTLTLGLSQQFTATADFSDGTSQDVTNVAQWHSSASGVASITVSGLATGLGLGSSTISATFGGVSGNTSVTVNAANVSSISITPANGSIAQGTQIGFKAVGTYNDGSTHDITTVVTWSSSNTAVLTLNPVNGLGSGVAPGLVDVTATLGSLSASVPFNVTNATIVSVSVTPTSATIPISARKTFTATGVFSDGSTQNVTTRVAWTSSNPAVATVGVTSADFGVATSLSSGATNIGASFSYAGASASGSSTLTVSSATLLAISLSPTTSIVAPGSGVGIGATGTYSDGSTQLLFTFASWSSSDNSVATVSQNGFVTGQSAGIATITAKVGSISGSATVLVEGATLTSIVITPTTSSVPVGFWRQFKATGVFSNGDTQDLTDYVVWTSSAGSVATISNAINTIAQATGLQPGRTTISAVFAGKAGAATLDVTNATLVSIALTPSSATIPEGASQAFTARGTFSDGSSIDVTSQVNWSSSTPSVASVTSRGVAAAVSSGSTTISASVGEVTGMAILTVQ